uniref:Uncharacterized protein n=1 Tax=Kalanchoe fedtschenkoi TaxID=63787 RepID=A0A7N0TCF6_KALFE
MKFGKEFKQQMVPEWTEAYMDYNGLKRILRQIRFAKQCKQPSKSLKLLRHRSRLHRPFNAQIPEKDDTSEERDLEGQVIDVNINRVGHRKVYETKIRGNDEENEEDEVSFFKKLDAELNKVNTFYKDKVEAVVKEAVQLDKQMDAFIALKVIVENPDTDDDTSHSTNSITEPSDSTNPRKEGTEMSQGNKQTERTDSNSAHVRTCTMAPQGEIKGSDHKSAFIEILDRVKINNTLETPLATLKGLIKDSREDELSFEKDELRKFYQKLRLLKHYSFMNLSAFAKIMKKYEKFTSRAAAKAYMKVVDSSYLGSTDEVVTLLERVENMFIKHFSNSNRRNAMKSLRPKVRKEKHSVTFFTGFFSGFCIALLVAIVLSIETMKLMDKKEGTSYMANIFPLYSLYGFLVLHLLLYGLDIYFWRRYRVNYPFIFGFKHGTELGYREVFLLSSGLAVLALASFLIVVVITFLPFNVIYRSSRFFLIRCIRRCICAPLYQVTLPDFFLADNLTSQVQAVRSFSLYVCYYGLGEFSRKQNKCHSHDGYNAFYFIVAIIPYWIRLLQCLRRLFEEKESVHAYNGLKYFLTIVAVAIRTAFELRKGKTWMALALVSSAVATVMNTYWDIVMDWGLLRRQLQNFLLRDKLVVSHRSVYFMAMFLYVFLRFCWMQLVLEFDLPSLHKMTALTIFSALEIIRRGIWNFFRLENEHLNNVGKYRAFKSVPLPFNYYDEGKEN